MGAAQRWGLESSVGGSVHTPGSRWTVHPSTHTWTLCVAWASSQRGGLGRVLCLSGATWPQNKVPAHEALLLFVIQLRRHVAPLPCVLGCLCVSPCTMQGKDAFLLLLRAPPVFSLLSLCLSGWRGHPSLKEWGLLRI